MKGSNLAAVFSFAALTMALRFSSNLVLTRLLAPEAFGVMLVMLSVITVFQLLAETGITAFTVRDELGATAASTETLHTVQIGRGIILGLLIFFLAPLLARLYGKPELTTLFQIAAVFPFLDGMKGLGNPLVTRARRQRYNELIGFIEFLFTTSVTLILASILRNSWALVFGYLSASITRLVLAKFAYNFPLFKFRLDRYILKRLFQFSKFIFLSTIISLIVAQFDKFFVGANLPLAVAGLYAMAFSLSEVLSNLVSRWRMIFFSDVADMFRGSNPSTEKAYALMRRGRVILLFLAGGGLTFGQRFFDIAFDDRYLQAGVFFSVFIIKPMISLFRMPHQQMLIAQGNTRVVFYADIMRLSYLVVTAPLLFVQFGVIGIAFAAATIDLLPALFLMTLNGRAGYFSWRGEALALAAIGAGALTGFVGDISVGAMMRYFFPAGT